jgi:RNA polymerase sigma factor (TIGR02999 family)
MQFQLTPTDGFFLSINTGILRQITRFRGQKFFGRVFLARMSPSLSLFRISDFTTILGAIEQGDSQAAAELLPLVYDELRRLAASKMAREDPGQTLQPTALVHEAWLRLAGSEAQQWKDRSHFFGAAAEAMRRILIDKARRKNALKRGNKQIPEELNESRIELRAPAEEILAVHEALDALDAEDYLAAEVVKLRYFVGLSIPQIAEALNISPRSADRHWAFARAWLKRAIDLRKS